MRTGGVSHSRELPRCSSSFLGPGYQLLSTHFARLEPFKARHYASQAIRKDLHSVRLSNILRLSKLRQCRETKGLTLIKPSLNRAGRWAYKLTPIFLAVAGNALPKTDTTRRLLPSLSATLLGSVNTIDPVGVVTSWASCWVSGVAIASKTVSTGPPAILATAATMSAAGRLRSMTSDAPRETRKGVWTGEATVIMGENPESLANWMAVSIVVRSSAARHRFWQKPTKLAHR